MPRLFPADVADLKEMRTKSESKKERMERIFQECKSFVEELKRRRGDETSASKGRIDIFYKKLQEIFDDPSYISAKDMYSLAVQVYNCARKLFRKNDPYDAVRLRTSAARAMEASAGSKTSSRRLDTLRCHARCAQMWCDILIEQNNSLKYREEVIKSSSAVARIVRDFGGLRCILVALGSKDRSVLNNTLGAILEAHKAHIVAIVSISAQPSVKEDKDAGDERKQSYRSARSILSEAKELLRMLPEETTRLATFVFNVALEMFVETIDLCEAVLWTNEAIEIASKFGSPCDDDDQVACSVRAHFLRADINLAIGNFDASLQSLSDGERLSNTAAPHADFLRIKIFCRSEQLERAKTAFDTLLRRAKRPSLDICLEATRELAAKCVGTKAGVGIYADCANAFLSSKQDILLECLEKNMRIAKDRETILACEVVIDEILEGHHNGHCPLGGGNFQKLRSILWNRATCDVSRARDDDGDEASPIDKHLNFGVRCCKFLRSLVGDATDETTVAFTLDVSCVEAMSHLKRGHVADAAKIVKQMEAKSGQSTTGPNVSSIRLLVALHDENTDEQTLASMLASLCEAYKAKRSEQQQLDLERRLIEFAHTAIERKRGNVALDALDRLCQDWSNRDDDDDDDDGPRVRIEFLLPLFGNLLDIYASASDCAGMLRCFDMLTNVLNVAGTTPGRLPPSSTLSRRACYRLLGMLWLVVSSCSQVSACPIPKNRRLQFCETALRMYENSILCNDERLRILLRIRTLVVCCTLLAQDLHTSGEDSDQIVSVGKRLLDRSDECASLVRSLRRTAHLQVPSSTCDETPRDSAEKDNYVDNVSQIFEFSSDALARVAKHTTMCSFLARASIGTDAPSTIFEEVRRCVDNIVPQSAEILEFMASVLDCPQYSEVRRQVLITAARHVHNAIRTKRDGDDESLRALCETRERLLIQMLDCSSITTSNGCYELAREFARGPIESESEACHHTFSRRFCDHFATCARNDCTELGHRAHEKVEDAPRAQRALEEVALFFSRARESARW